MLRYMRLTVCSVLFAFSPNLFAETNFRADLGTGFVHVQNEDYDEGFLLDHALAYAQSGFAYRVGALYIGELKPDGAEEDSEIEIRGLYFGVAKELDLDAIKFEFGGGVMFSETEATFLGREVAEENETDPYINIKVIKDLNKLLSLQADWKYIDDVSGGDLHLFQAGVRFSF